MKLVCVVLNCGPMFEESEQMFEAAFNKFEFVNIVPNYFFVENKQVQNGEKACVGLYVKQGFSTVLSKSEKADLSVNFEVAQTLSAPVKKDEEVGKVEIFYKNYLIFSGKIYTIEAVDSVLFKDKIKDILKEWNS